MPHSTDWTHPCTCALLFQKRFPRLIGWMKWKGAWSNISSAKQIASHLPTGWSSSLRRLMHLIYYKYTNHQHSYFILTVLWAAVNWHGPVISKQTRNDTISTGARRDEWNGFGFKKVMLLHRSGRRSHTGMSRSAHAVTRAQGWTSYLGVMRLSHYMLR